ncbi:putative holin-like toxin [Lederbergia graminis]|uniref:Holin-like toxin n=1 Tax=Lederbergia graminis TaxID=735518 RepID=A0ABW0LHY8_9BACI
MEGGGRVSVFETLTLTFTFGALVVAMLSFNHKK